MTNQPNRLDQIETLQLQAQQQINANIVAIAELTTRMNQASIDADADRKMIVGILEHMDEVHAENQRILNYLFGQQRGDGHGS